MINYHQLFCNKNVYQLFTVNRCLQQVRQNGKHTNDPTIFNSFRFQSTLINKNLKNVIPDSTAGSKFSQDWSNAKPFEDIPTMGTFQLLRNYLPGGKYANLDVAQLLMAMKKDMGIIFKMKGYFGRLDAVISNNPDDIEKVLRNEGIWPVRPNFGGLRHHRSVHRADFFQGVGGLIATQGENWGSFRSVVNPILLQPKNVRMYLKKVSKVNREFLSRILEIRDPHTFEVPSTFEEELHRWSLESISVVALDKQLGLINTNRDNPEVMKLFGYITDFFKRAVEASFKPPIWKMFKTKSFEKYMETLDDVTGIANKYVEEAMQRIEQDHRNGVAEKSESEKSVLEKLLKIDKKIATVMAIDMILTGVDTKTTTFTGLLLCLAKNPNKQAILREEILKVLPFKDSEFTEATLKNMPYLRACIKEALRIYPLVPGTTRSPVNDVILSGYRVPKGTQVSLINISMLDNDEHYPRAKEFLPERWLRPCKNVSGAATTIVCPQSLKSNNPFIYIPFGYGPRSCVGRRIAEMEIELAAAYLVRNFHIEFNYSTENAFKCFLIRAPNIPLRFKFIDVEK